MIPMNSTVAGIKGVVEEVADLNGLAIPAMLEIETAKVKAQHDVIDKNINGAGATGQQQEISCSMYQLVQQASQELSDSGDALMHPKVRQKLGVLKKPCDMEDPADFLKLAAVYQASAGTGRKGYISRLMQLEHYDWMTEDSANRCVRNLKQAVTEYRSATFEFCLQEIVVGRNGKGLNLQGQVDILTPNVLWEVKCVQELRDIHFLQLAAYAWLWRRTHEVRSQLAILRLWSVGTDCYCR